MKRSLQVCIIVRFPTASSQELVSSLERCLDALPAETVPLYWSLPHHALLKESSSRAAKVASRLRERGEDGLLPAGFAGAYHPLLTADELAGELRWWRDNPWGEAAAELSNREPEALFPLAPDLLRETALRRYGDAKRLLVAALRAKRLYLLEGDSVEALPLLAPTRPEAKHIARQLKRLYRSEEEDRLAILLDGTEAAPAHLEALLRALQVVRKGRPSILVTGLEELNKRPSPASTQPASLISQIEGVPTDPLSRYYQATAAHLRRTKNHGGEELTRRRLERLSAHDLDEKRRLVADASRVTPPERSIVADMFGEIALAEADFSALFIEGRIRGLRQGQRELLVGKPAASRLVRGARPLEFQTVGAYSFEEPRERGLRTILRLDGEETVSPGTIVVDYAFAEGRSDLKVTLYATYPELSGGDWVDEYALLEMPLFALGARDEVEIEGQYPDGERYELRLHASERPLQLFGTRFRFRGQSGAVSLEFPTPQGGLPEVVPVRFRPEGHGFLFCINPHGSYLGAPSEAFSGLSEQLEFSMNGEAAGAEDDRKSLPTAKSR